VKKRNDSDEVRTDLVEEAVPEDEDLSEVRVVAFWNDPPPFAQCRKGVGCC